MALNADEAGQRSRAPRSLEWSGEDCARAFRRAARTLPWTLGYVPCPGDVAAPSLRDVRGQLPPGLKGTFYRNGPARHELGGQRYAHRWDGDGMVQAFRFGAQLSHVGRYVRTEKFVAETKAGRFLRNAFGTYVDPLSPPIPDDIDVMNAANINVCMAGDELLALWEPGSAHRLDPQTLETLGVKTWAPELKGRAFSGHPKREPDGTLWNFGMNPMTGELTLYCIGADGVLQRSHTTQVDQMPSMHDFAVTEGHLVFVLPPMPINGQRLDSGMSFAHACEWKPHLGTRVLVVSKADWSQRWYQLPPSCMFHFANAWEDAAGVIHVQLMSAAGPVSLFAGWTMMRGEYQHRSGAHMVLMELTPDGCASQERVADLEAEFPVVDPTVVGRRNATVLCIGRSARRDPGVPGYDELVSFAVETGHAQRYSFGADWLVEEHVLVPDASDPSGPAQWAVGTALDLQRGRTVLSVFRADQISDGPVAQATLPYAVPIGLHGCFVPESV